MATDTAAAREGARNLKDCDLVLKGGVTSGLIYPKAILELWERHHRFRSIGGTSAGAVAAAFAAAAEYKREDNGFVRLKEINNKLQGKDAKQPDYLRKLFQGNKATEPLLNVVTNMASYLGEIRKIDTSKGLARPGVIWRLLRLIGRVVKESEVHISWWGALIGAVCGLLLAAFIAGFIGFFFVSWKWRIFVAFLVVLGVILGWIGYWLGSRSAGLASLFRIVVSDVPKNHFGICSGLKDPAITRYQGLPAAGEWLHESIQEIAGRSAKSAEEVLTFADLKQLDPDRPDDKPKIELKLMVTNVSEGRPYVLPFDDPFLFREKDFQELFPDPIVQRLANDDSEIARNIAGIKPPKGYRLLPKGDLLPVAVAARISMSFPLFFSSVPLYALPLWARERFRKGKFMPRIERDEFNADALPWSLRAAGAMPGEIMAALRAADRLDTEGRYAPKEQDLIPHWFSDGGITSNFPIHFFDQWLPKRPTFGITLRNLPDYDPRNGNADVRAEKHYLDSVERGKEPTQGPHRGADDADSAAKTESRTANPLRHRAHGARMGAPARRHRGPAWREDTVPLEWRIFSIPTA
jgi:predicted acylesterase/phospholipase RssA